MSYFSWKLLYAVPAAYVISFFAPGNAFAASNIQPEEVAITAAPSSLDELETVANTTSDLNLIVANNEQPAETVALIQPSDWQYTSLKNLEGKYDCNTGLTGAPVSREVFATALNSCLQKAEPLLAKARAKKKIRKKPAVVAPAPTTPEAAPAPAPAPEAVPAPPAPVDTSAQDIEALKRLTQEFRAELSNLDVRVQKVEKTVLAQSQASQFSTTTKLKGEVAIGLNGVLSGGGTGSNPTVGDRVRLLFETSFTGKDKLYTRLATGNLVGFGNLQGTPANPSGTEGALTFSGNTNNAIAIDWLAYQFPIGSGSVYAAAFNGIHSDYADNHNPYFADFTGASGALSFFAEENPIYKIGGGTGIGVTLPLSSGTFLDSVNLSYFGGTSANSPAAGSGIFGGRNSIFAQVNFKPSDKFDFGLAYVRAFHNDGAIYDFGSGGSIVGSSLVGTGYSNSNSFGLSAAYRASDKFSLNGFVSTTSADLTAGGNNSILTYALGAAFPNIGQPGNLLGIFAGQSPSVTNAPNGNSYHLEGFYKYKLNDGLSITPGLIYLTNPNQAGTGGSLLGTVRTTFTF